MAETKGLCSPGCHRGKDRGLLVRTLSAFTPCPQLRGLASSVAPTAPPTRKVSRCPWSQLLLDSVSAGRVQPSARPPACNHAPWHSAWSSVSLEGERTPAKAQREHGETLNLVGTSWRLGSMGACEMGTSSHGGACTLGRASLQDDRRRFADACESVCATLDRSYGMCPPTGKQGACCPE